MSPHQDDILGRPRRWTTFASLVDLAAKPRVESRITVAASPKSARFDLARTAMIVVDMQNDFCHPDGWLHATGVDIAPLREIIPPLEDLLTAIRDVEVPVIWLNWANRPDRINLPPNVIHSFDPEDRATGIGHRASEQSDAVLTEGSWGADITPGLSVGVYDIHIPKFRMSGFWDTALDSTLRGLGVNHLLFAGVNLDQCVMATLTDAACAGYDCLLVNGVTATTSPAYCIDATLYNVRECYGFVVDQADLRNALSPHRVFSTGSDA